MLAVRPDTDGRHFVSAGGDGVLRYWDAAVSEQVVWLATARSGQDWIVASPAGRFDGNQGGREAIGYRLDRGLTVVLADRFYRDYHSPGLLKTLWAGAAPKALPVLNNVEPPLVRFLTAAPAQTLPGDTFKFDVEITDRGSGIECVGVHVNNRRIGVLPVNKRPGADGREIRTYEIPLPHGDVELTAYAQGTTIGSRESEPAVLRFRYSAANREQRLHVVAAGVNDCPGMTRLRFAQNDADALVKLFETQRHGDFKEISIHPFPARGPTRDEILDALKNLKSQPNDTLVVSLSGHGIVRDNEYFYMTSDARKNDLKTALSGTDLIEALYRVPATKIFLILDTCQAEGIKTGLAVVDKSVRKQGIPVIYAAGHHDEAKETEKLGHGLLTYSLLYSVRAAEGKFGDPDLRLAGQLVDSTNWSRSSIDIAQKILRDNFGQDVPTVNHITGSQFPLLFLK